MEIAASLVGYMIETEEISLIEVTRGVKIFTLSPAHTAVRGAGATNPLIRLLLSNLKVYSS